MNIINPKGEITLLNQELEPVLIATVKQGLTYGSHNAKMQTVRLTIMPGNNELSDLFVFYTDGKMPFTHLQSKYINPTLHSLYLKLLTNENTCQEFITEIIADYFVANLGYTVQDNLLNLNNIYLK